MQPQAQSEHAWLQQFVGQWKSSATANMGPDKPLETFEATEVVRSIGSLWIHCEAIGEDPDKGTMGSIMMLGYDPVKERFVGTFVGSPMTNLWVYEGTLAGNVLTLDTLGPDFVVPGQYAKYQDIIELIDQDHRTLTSYLIAADGARLKVVESNYTRVG